MPHRRVTLDEANAALPAIRVLLPRLRQSLVALRFATEQVEDIEKLYGPDALADPQHPAHDEYIELAATRDAEHGAVEGHLGTLERLGAELKDPEHGLVDFRAMRMNEEIYLCWREGEAKISHWHPIVGGFAARRPLDGLTGSEPIPER
ncbi:MAG: DUF2203 family protein [Thermoplasmatota archaeon]